MANTHAPRGVRLWMVAGILVLGGGGLLAFKGYRARQVNSAKNYQPRFEVPIGWRSQPHGPSTLFKVEDPKTNLVLRGSVNQVISEFNPTPELDTEGIAEFYADRTSQAMPEWTTSRPTKYSNALGTQFDIIRRATKDRVVVTAYSVKGNTTLLITLFGKNKSMSQVDPGMGNLYSFLNTVSLNEQDMSSL